MKKGSPRLKRNGAAPAELENPPNIAPSPPPLSENAEALEKSASPLGGFSSGEIPLEKVPPELKVFTEKTQSEILSQHLAAPEQLDSILGIMSGMGCAQEGINIPEFARKASKQFWKYFLPKGFDPEKSPEHLGMATKLIEELMRIPRSREKHSLELFFEATMPHLLQIIDKELPARSDEEKSSFFLGRAKAKELADKFKSPEYLRMLKRAPVYFIMTLCWRSFEGFHTQAEAERWLRANKIVGKTLTTREVYQIFKQVGFRPAKPGRPKKAKPDT